MQANSRQSQLLTEAISEEQMSRALKALSYMRKVDFSAIPSLNSIVKTTLDQLNADLARQDTGPIKKASDVVGKMFNALKSMSSAPLKTPTGKAIDVAATVLRGFNALPSIIDANVRDPEASAEKQLTDAVTGKSEVVQSLIKKAFTSSVVNADQIAKDVMRVKPSELSKLIKQIKASEESRDVLELIDKAVKAKQTGSAPTAQAKPSDGARKTGSTTSPTSSASANGGKDQLRDDLRKAQKSSGVAEQDFIRSVNAVTKLGYVLKKRS